jgi:MGT family glycosyltransferase
VDSPVALALRADVVLYLTAEPLEYAHGGWPEKVRLVGPGLWEPPPEAEPEPAEGARPLALVTCSTEFQDDGRLIEVALEALADEDLEVVATTAAVDPSRFRAPPNARVVRFAAHGPLLRRAAVVVCHGGMGITQKALAAGVPVCVVPFGRDQLDVARHVEVAGAGAGVSPARLTAARLREAVVLARSRRAGAQRVARAFAEAGGAAACVAALEALVRGA